MDAATANRNTYDEHAAGENVPGSPHLSHPSLRRRMSEMAKALVASCSLPNGAPVRVLDVGAGHGESSVPFLEAGAEVSAVELSARYLIKLGENYPNQLRVIAEDELTALQNLALAGERFDIVSCVSFLHHLPEYVAFVERSAALLSSRGIWFSFQDPLLYGGLPALQRSAAELAYATWRMRQPNALSGLGRKLRRSFGIYLPSSVHDMVEYHVVRGGVDSAAVSDELVRLGFSVECHRYWSTQSRWWQGFGERMGWSNTFSITARHQPRA